MLLTSTAGFALLYVAATASLGTTPEATDSGAAVAAWFLDNREHVRLWLWLSTLGVPFFAVFATLVRSSLPSPHRDLFFFGAIAFVAETAVQGWFWAGLSLHPDQLDPATARTLLDVASFWGPVLTATTIMTLAPVALLALRREAGLPRWLGVVSAVALVEQVAETVTTMGTHGFTAPGGPMNLFLGAGLVAVAWISLGIAVARAMAD
ncbi:MAG: hypothetical protein ABIY48_00890 [Acidimicrobiales bacterium]